MDRQKLLLVFGGSWLLAGLLAWFLYSTASGAKLTKLKPLMAAARDLPAGTRLKKSDLKKVNVPERDAPANVFLADTELVNHALLFPVAANEVISSGKIASLAGVEGVPSIIPSGYRAVSVLVSDASSAAGLILPRAKVDVICSRTGSLNEAVSNLILQDVQVLSVGRVTELQMSAPDAKGSAVAVNPSSGTQRAVTLLVTPEDASKLEMAKNNGKISLALRNPIDTGRIGNPTPTTGEVIDPLMGDRRSRLQQLRNRQGTGGRGGNVDLRDDRAWARLVNGEEGPPAPKPPKVEKKEPPAKPKRVVDVYRGDKHVQEIFQPE
ncbi:MAG: Flp pilus assembly protein CpaB [Bryobacteraceae bacterium]|nr:Flp pilus assembly protein CpaB [Bryobacteraceae bacterium]